MKKITKKQLLINNPVFKRMITTIANNYNVLRAINKKLPFSDNSDCISVLATAINNCKDEFNVSVSFITKNLGIDQRTMQNILGETYRIQQVKRNPNSFLDDRMYYARAVVSNSMTAQEVADTTGYAIITIRKWVKDYRAYGSDTMRAVAFSRRSL